MCRGSHQGGRRCPGQSSSAAKKAAANRRKNNRRAKKNVKNFFASQGINDTADAVDDMTPAQIPGLLDALGIDSSVLGDVETPVSVHAPAEKRSAEEIITIATQEAKEHKIASFATTVDPDEDTGILTQEQLKNAFSALIVKAVEDDSWKKGYTSILDYSFNEYPEDTAYVYSVMNKLDLSDDFNERDRQLQILKDEINSHIKKAVQSAIYEVYSGIARSIVDGEHAPDTDVTQEILNQLPSSADRLYPLRKLAIGKMTARDFGGGLYYFEDIEDEDDPYGSYHYLYAPNGFRDLHDVVFTSRILGERKPRQLGVPILYGGGVTGLEKDKLKELILHRDFATAVNDFSRTAEKDTKGNTSHSRDERLEHATELVGETFYDVFSVDSLEINDRDIEDLHVSHRLSRSGTFVQSELGMDISLDSPRYVEKVRKFRMGLLPQETITITGKVQGLSKTLMSINVNPEEAEYDDEKTRKNLEPEVTGVRKFLSKKILSREVDSDIVDIIEGYTKNGYTKYALDASGVISPEEYRPGNKKMNDFIKLYQDEVRPEPRNTFRGVRVPQGMNNEQYYNSVTVGDVVTTTRITSTSYSASTLSNFIGGDNVISVFHTRKGLPIESMSNHDTEREIIIPAGEEYVCVGKHYDDETETYVFYYADKDINDGDFQ